MFRGCNTFARPFRVSFASGEVVDEASGRKVLGSLGAGLPESALEMKIVRVNAIVVAGESWKAGREAQAVLVRKVSM